MKKLFRKLWDWITRKPKTYQVTGWVRSDRIPRVISDKGEALWTGQQSDDWQEMKGTFKARKPRIRFVTGKMKPEGYSEFDSLTVKVMK